MGPTAQDVINTGNASNQQAIVKRATKKTIVPKRRIIPGGKNLLDEIDQKTLQRAIYTWLKGCRFFSEVTIGLSCKPELRASNERKVMDFPNDDIEVWHQPAFGKKYLSEQMADVLASQKLLALTAKKDGLYVTTEVNKDSDFGPKAEDWEPYIEYLPIRTSEY